MTEPTFRPASLEPSAEQLAVQTARVRHLLVEANAGAAKTTTLALRMAQALARGAKPGMLLALTYTEPAVQALLDRLRHIGVAEADIAGMHLHTFESFSAFILERMEGARVLPLRTQEQVKPYVLQAMERARTLPEERYPELLTSGAAPAELVEGLLKSFVLLKGRLALERLDEGTLMSPDTAEDLGIDYATLRIRNAYEWLRRGGHPDHPAFRYLGDASYDLARAALDGQLFFDHSPLDLGLALIVVDEMHDTNRAMFTILQALLQRNRRAAFVGVGDRDQVIHSQAGAEAGFMKEYFVQEIGTPMRLPLTGSYRFGSSLARAAGALAHKPYESFSQVGTTIHHLHAESPAVLASLVARLARDHMAQEELETLRVLLRRPAQSILLERALLALGVDYQAEGFQSFLRRREVLLVRGMHAYCTDDYTGFEDTALREDTLSAMLLFAGAWIESHELRHVDAVTAQRQAVREAASMPDGMRAFIENQILRNADPAAHALLGAGMAVLSSGDLGTFGADFLRELRPTELAGRALVRRDDVDQVNENLKALVEMVMLESGATLPDVFRLLHEMDARRSRMRANRRLALSSIEAAKGLEFDHVVIPNLSRGEFQGGEVGLTENRNLLYVAMTRARHRLTLGFDPGRPSKFLVEAGLIKGEA
ncbi:DNA helicase-2 / ATP-dependent DNA helicase PcrA [Roseateles sp. YR242]|uniref:UvrD-helicase domain-containing protein n=1 Tax=Roseateles sp. YR242 TaxID=1855305 RepID=UPI0008D346DD|nr:ATP-dependent helicase [Roseateles sp. YR242]SEL06988.1 DNA helicase-2 / ATP-dependent DNA helicase PcrA [Roseateles sp. YR242]